MNTLPENWANDVNRKFADANDQYVFKTLLNLT